MTTITLRQLEIFAQTVEHGSFRRCAEHIGVSQVAISDHIRALEAGLGRKLFDRPAGGSAVLSPAGERAYQRVIDILADLDDLVWDSAPGREARRRKLVVSLHPFINRYLQDSLTEFGGRHAGVELHCDLESLSGTAASARVRARTADLAYFYSFDGREAPESKLMRHEPLAIFIAADHPLAAREVVSIADLAEVPAIHLSAGHPLRELIDLVFHQVGLGQAPVALETGEFGLILTSVRRNRGFVCMFEASESEVAHDGGLKILRLDRPLPGLQIRQTLRHAARHDPLLTDLAAQLDAALAAP